MKVKGTTRVVGVIGHPVAHSASPQMHNAAFGALGMDWVYVAFDVLPGEVRKALEGIKALGMRGINVTVPHKGEAFTSVDLLTPEAEATKAVNTVVVEEGKSVGYNTDVYGFKRALMEAGLRPLPEKVVLLGAGGAARAVAYALGTSEGVEEVVVLNRTEERAEGLAEEMERRTGRRFLPGPLTEDALVEALDGAGLLVNATSVGMHPDVDSSPLPSAEVLRPGLWVYDIVYVPPKTKLVRQAEGRGARAMGGTDMLVYQGARAFRLWTGLEPPVEVMRRALLEALGVRRGVESCDQLT